MFLLPEIWPCSLPENTLNMETVTLGAEFGGTSEHNTAEMLGQNISAPVHFLMTSVALVTGSVPCRSTTTVFIAVYEQSTVTGMAYTPCASLLDSTGDTAEELQQLQWEDDGNKEM